MINTLTHEELRALMSARGAALVSIYVPTFRAGKEVEKGRIHLKNALSEAEQQLAQGGLRAPEIRELLEPAQALVTDGAFWREQQDGLALFLDGEGLREFRLPLHFEPLATVSDRFHLKPLLPLFAADGRFYVLALSQNEVRLLRGNRYGLDEVDLEDVPQSLAEALRFDDPESTLQYHAATGNPSGPDSRSPIFHGQGVGTDDEKDDLLRYFHKLDAGLADMLSGERAPLVVAGVDYLLPIYAEANTYEHLLPQGIAGNPEEWTAEELRRRAWERVEPLFAQDQEAAAARFQTLAGQGDEQATVDLAQMAAAAYNGRVDTFFTATGVQRWGSFDKERNAAAWHPQKQPGDLDLLDFTAVHTLANGGTVYAVLPEEMPVDAPGAAVLRY